MQVLKILLIIIAVLWLLRVAVRLLFPWAVKKAAEKMMSDAQQQFQGRRSSPPPPTPDGKIRIDYVPPQDKEKKGPQRAGEFVDFEEVK